jgi:hypothetical protein
MLSVTAGHLSVEISGLRLQSMPGAAFIRPRCHRGLIKTMAQISDINAVTSQLIYDHWGIDLPTILELAAPFQPIVEMLCSVESLYHPQALIELAVTESSSSGFWLNDASVISLFPAGFVTKCPKAFEGLLSCFRSWNLRPESADATDDAEEKASIARTDHCRQVKSDMTTWPCNENIQTFPAVGRSRPTCLPTLPTSQSVNGPITCFDADLDFVEMRRQANSLCSKLSSTSCSVDMIEGTISRLTIEDDPGPKSGQTAEDADDDHAMSGYSSNSNAIEDGSDDNLDGADYWQWDYAAQRYRHWDESREEWVYFPETFH